MKARVFWVTMLVAAFSLLWLPSANAYIDPGSGSFVFQALIGLVTRKDPEQPHDDV